MIGPRAQQVKPVLGFQFVALPVEVLRRPDLSAAAKLLAAVVMDSARGSRGGSCRLTNASLAARIGRSAASVKRLLGELEAAGLVRRDHVAEKHQRTAVVPTWAAQESTTGQADGDRARSTPGAGMNHPPAQDRAAIQTPGSEPTQTNALAPTPGGEDRKPTPREIAEAMRAMVAGRYAPQMFDAKPPGGITQMGVLATPQTPDVATLARRVGYSAVAAAGFVRRDQRPPCPAPRDGAELARMRAARAESLRIPHTVGGMANLGKM